MLSYFEINDERFLFAKLIARDRVIISLFVKDKNTSAHIFLIKQKNNTNEENATMKKITGEEKRKLKLNQSQHLISKPEVST